ncbi:putative virulence factor transmembrane protein [Burkholderia cepacia]|nr:putative virulence factor transmembrane protein [Burkholderia cepacia]
MNPLQRMDYPTEWQLLWAQGLVTPNKNDDMVRTDPDSFTTLKSIGALVYGNRGTETFKGFYAKYVDKAILLLRTRYGMNSKYFYTVGSKNQKDWRELAGIRVEIAIPSRLDATFARSRLVDRMMTFYEIGPPSPKTLWSRDTPPDVQITQGGANAGFTSLNNALDYLQANPDKSVWVMNWDAPNFPPTDAQINENLVVLFLAGPTFNTEREPLAWIGKAAAGNADAFSKSPARHERCRRGRQPSIRRRATQGSRFRISDTSFTTPAPVATPHRRDLSDYRRRSPKSCRSTTTRIRRSTPRPCLATWEPAAH